MRLLCEICLKTFEIGVLKYPILMVIRRQEFTLDANIICNSVARDICIFLRQCTETKTQRPNI